MTTKDRFESIAARLTEVRDDMQGFAKADFAGDEVQSAIVSAARNVDHAILVLASAYEREKKVRPC